MDEIKKSQCSNKQEVILYKLHNPEKSNNELAMMFDVHRSTIGRWFKEKEFKELEKTFNEDKQLAKQKRYDDALTEKKTMSYFSDLALSTNYEALEIMRETLKQLQFKKDKQGNAEKKSLKELSYITEIIDTLTRAKERENKLAQRNILLYIQARKKEQP